MSRDNTRYVTIECWRCFGAGYVERFAHVLGGVCFVCRGKQRVTFPAWKLKRLPLGEDAGDARSASTWAETLALGELDAPTMAAITLASAHLDERARLLVLRFIPRSVPLADLVEALRSTRRR